MKSKILVADDSITIQKIVAMAFEHEDTIVEGIGDGEAAFNKLDDFRPDIVLADIEMPGYNGFELSQMIKQSEDFQSTRVLLLASDFEEFDEDQFRSSQADDHIAKPFKSDDIINKVKELLSVDYKKNVAESLQERQVQGTPEDQVAEEVFSLPLGNLLDATEDFSDLAPDGPANDTSDNNEDFFSLPDTALIEEPDVLVNEEQGVNENSDDGTEAFELLSADMVESPEDIPKLEGRQQETSLDDLLDSLEEISQEKVSADSFQDDSSAKEKVSADNFLENSPATESQPSIVEVSDTLSEILENVKDLRELAAPREETVNETADSDMVADTEIAQEAASVVQDSANGTGSSHAEELSDEPHSADLEDDNTEEIIAEPEDLLQQIMSSSTLTALHKRVRPESIRESLTYLSRLSNVDRKKSTTKAAVEEPMKVVQEASALNPVDMDQQIESQVRLYLNESLGDLIENEFSELSDKIQQSVRTVVRAVAPGIVRDVIQAKIEKIRNQE